ncbi:MAG: hypothetical protein JSR57_09675 [Verrucomicrobia bacterium]|nr:hypothetical protein [Verrucomicrobiota bacterium]
MKKFLAWSASVCFVVLTIGWAFRLWTLSHEKIYPALPPHSFYSFTLTESDANIPCLQAEIEGISFLAKLDMGYDGVLSLPKDLLEQLIHKRDVGTVLYGSIKGNKYETQVFTIPKLYIGDLALVNLPAEESHLEFEHDANLGPDANFEPSDVMARIGWRAFLGAVVLIDLHKSIAICCDSLETLKEEGYPLEQFASINFLPRKEFIEFEANIGNRRVKCILDTGCTVNLIHSHSTALGVVGEELKFANIDLAHPLPPTTLSIGRHHLGSCVFHETQLPFAIEAIVGVDFLKTQIVCIDFINHKLHLCPVAKNNSLDSLATLITSSAP